ncbi:response regulator [Paenibacillus sp. CAA11]|uniref:response regulator n=1 Tax=Paenibacillus sp. CAA11 TaxID=1532905 RepID=UPI00131EEFBE|nr:response regulator [Paenibacillus sp. CAA11]
MIHAYLLDADRLAREELKQLLEQSGRVKVVGSSSQAAAALEQIGRLQPQVLFVDTQLPGSLGVEAAERALQIANNLKVVYITSQRVHALSAFEQKAFDYILKPPTRKRLDRVLSRLSGRAPGKGGHPFCTE